MGRGSQRSSSLPGPPLHLAVVYTGLSTWALGQVQPQFQGWPLGVRSAGRVQGKGWRDPQSIRDPLPASHPFSAGGGLPALACAFLPPRFFPPSSGTMAFVFTGLNIMVMLLTGPKFDFFIMKPRSENILIECMNREVG